MLAPVPIDATRVAWTLSFLSRNRSQNGLRKGNWMYSIYQTSYPFLVLLKANDVFESYNRWFMHHNQQEQKLSLCSACLET